MDEDQRKERCLTCRFANVTVQLNENGLYCGNNMKGVTLESLEDSRQIDGALLECRRYPPTSPPEAAMYGIFPGVMTFEWCGEYQPRAVSTAGTLDRTVDSLGLPTSVRNALLGAGIVTVRDLTAKRARDLVLLRQFGDFSLNKVLTALAAIGLRLRPNDSAD